MIKDDLYASHLPILAKMVEKTIGGILEFGVGYSTVLLHTMCKKNKRPVFSYENDLSWFKKYEGFDCDFHKMIYVEDWDTVITKNLHFGLVFIDNKPGAKRRDLALKLANKATVIMLHDSEPEQNKFFGYKKIYPYFKYVYQYTACKPHTAVLSNFISYEI